MKKSYVIIGLGFTALLLMGATGKWTNQNRPRTFTITASAGSPIPTSFNSSDTQSLVSGDLRGQNYHHLMVFNETTSPVRILTHSTIGSAGFSDLVPYAVQIASSGSAAFDDMSILKNMLLRSEDNAVVSGDVRINVW